jgi:hypothetical protein
VDASSQIPGGPRSEDAIINASMILTLLMFSVNVFFFWVLLLEISYQEARDVMAGMPIRTPYAIRNIFLFNSTLCFKFFLVVLVLLRSKVGSGDPVIWRACRCARRRA